MRNPTIRAVPLNDGRTLKSIAEARNFIKSLPAGRRRPVALALHRRSAEKGLGEKRKIRYDGRARATNASAVLRGFHMKLGERYSAAQRVNGAKAPRPQIWLLPQSLDDVAARTIWR
jgi:hypothetical protein